MADMGPIDLNAVANGILVVIVGLLSWLGIKKGRDAKEEDSTPASRHVELAGAVIDNHKADQLIDAVNHNTHALRETSGIFEDIREELREVRNDIRALTMELVRGRRR